MSITSAQAVILLENVLFESATNAQAHAAQWVSISQADTASTVVSDISTAMAGTAEAGIAAQVVRYYEGALGREPTVQDIAYYVRIAEQGLTSDQIAQGATAVSQSTWNQIAGYFAGSAEFSSLYGGSQTTIISALYQNILGRAPSGSETVYYQKVLEGGTSVSTVVQYFVTSLEFQDKSDAKIEAKLAATGVDAVAGTVPVVTSTGTVSVGGGVSIIDLNSSSGTSTATITLASGIGSGLKVITVPTVTTTPATLAGTGSTIYVLEGAGSVSSAGTGVVTIPGVNIAALVTTITTVHSSDVTSVEPVHVTNASHATIELTGIQSGHGMSLIHA